MNGENRRWGSEEENDELGLSLRVAPSSCSTVDHETREEEEEGLIRVSDNINMGAGIMNSIITSPPNKRARVSVRARCEASTVSATIIFAFIHYHIYIRLPYFIVLSIFIVLYI